VLCPAPYSLLAFWQARPAPRARFARPPARSSRTSRQAPRPGAKRAGPLQQTYPATLTLSSSPQPTTPRAQVATPLQQARCELLAFPWTPDVLAMCNLLAAAAESARSERSGGASGSAGASHPRGGASSCEQAAQQVRRGAI